MDYMDPDVLCPPKKADKLNLSLSPPWLTKRPLILNGRLANRELPSLVKRPQID